MKKIMTEKKITLLSLNYKNRKKVYEETEKIKKVLIIMPIVNITELNKRIYAEVTLVWDKSSVSVKNLKRYAKTWMGILSEKNR